MRLRGIRFTVRRMMLLILGLAIGLHLTIAAWRAYQYGHPHLHSAIYKVGGGPSRAVAVRTQPFWPAFWRRSMGWPGGEERACFMGGDALVEMCELANPEIRMPIGPNNYAANYTKEQNDLFWRLWRAKLKLQQDRASRPGGIAGTAIPWLLDDSLPRCLSPATVRILLFCSSGVDSLLTNARKHARSTGSR